MKHSLGNLSVFSLLILLLGVMPSLLAQPPGPREGGFGRPGPGDGAGLIHELNRALVRAGAAALSETQESAVAALVQEHWANRPARDPENQNYNLFQEYGQAILNRDAETAKSIAGRIAEANAVRMAERMQAQVDFQIALLDILEDSQVQALQQQYGDRGLLRLLGGPGGMAGFGRPGGGSEGFRRGMRSGPNDEVKGP